MPEINLAELYAQMQAMMLLKHQSSTKSFAHSVIKGDATEASWIKWFEDYLPRRYKAAKGVVIDSDGKESDQIDLILYDAQYSYLVFQSEDGTPLIPAESVYAVFEIKQNLNKDHMDYARKKAKSVRALKRTSAQIRHAGGTYSPKDLHNILAGILTTRSEWKGLLVENAVKYAEGSEKNEQLDFICSISSNTIEIEHDTFDSDPLQDPKIHYCDAQESLVFLFLRLLTRLQKIGTVPAIDFSEYAKHLNGKIYQL